MSKTLFIGCSHSMGYNGNIELEGPNVWQENNYAEIYSKIYDKEVVIMASAGAGNRTYPRFLANALELYNDIDSVFIQSTYWGRFPVAINPDLNDEKIFPKDFFLDENFKSEKIHRYSISLSVENKYLETFLKPEPSDYDIFPYHPDTEVWKAEPDVRRSSHMYIRMWHHSNTHLEQEDYFTSITMCDMLCTYNNIPLYVWNINDRCYLPKETLSYYTKLKSTKIANINAIDYLKKNYSIDTVDGEHYSTNVHRAIAERYIPYIKEQQ
jgi:hypothetical protein